MFLESVEQGELEKLATYRAFKTKERLGLL